MKLSYSLPGPVAFLVTVAYPGPLLHALAVGVSLAVVLGFLLLYLESDLP